MRASIRRLFLLAFLLHFFITGSFAQQVNGTVVGRVTDASQGVVPGARVVKQAVL